MSCATSQVWCCVTPRTSIRNFEPHLSECFWDALDPVISTSLLYSLCRFKALGANIHIHLWCYQIIFHVSTRRQRKNSNPYITIGPITLTEPPIIEPLCLSFLRHNHSHATHAPSTLTEYWILDPYLDFTTDVDSNIVDLIYCVRLPGMWNRFWQLWAYSTFRTLFSRWKKIAQIFLYQVRNWLISIIDS